MLAGKNKLYFFLNRINEVKETTPSGKPIRIHPLRHLNNQYYQDELNDLLTILEKDKKVIRIVEMPNPEEGYLTNENGFYVLELLSAFDDYYNKIQNEQEYQDFTGKKPPAPKKGFDEIKDKYEKLLEEVMKPSQPSLEERYDNLLKDIKSKQQKNNRHKPLRKPQVVKKQPTCEWSEDFKWQGKSFIFGKYGVINFNSKPRIALFRELTKAKGGWVTVRKLKEVTEKDESYVRPTIGQVERSMKADLRKFISFPSTGEDDPQPKPSQGAYRIKFTPKSL